MFSPELTACCLLAVGFLIILGVNFVSLSLLIKSKRVVSAVVSIATPKEAFGGGGGDYSFYLFVLQHCMYWYLIVHRMES